MLPLTHHNISPHFATTIHIFTLVLSRRLPPSFSHTAVSAFILYCDFIERFVHLCAASGLSLSLPSLIFVYIRTAFRNTCSLRASDTGVETGGIELHPPPFPLHPPSPLPSSSPSPQILPLRNLLPLRGIRPCTENGV